MPASAESITPFRVEFEQVVADDDDPRESIRIGTMVFSASPHRPPRGDGVDRSHPAVDSPIDEKLPAFGQLQRQSVKAELLDTFIRCIGETQRRVSSDQKCELTQAARIVSYALVVHATPVESVHHPPISGDVLAPKRPFEQESGAQVMSWPIKMREVFVNGLPQRHGTPMDHRNGG